MTALFRCNFFMFLMVIGVLLIAGCGQNQTEKAQSEALKLAAKDFQPTLLNLDTIITAGDVQAARDTLSVLMQKLDKIEDAEVPDRLADKADEIESQIAKLATSLDELSMTLDNPSLATIDCTVINGYRQVRMNFSRLGGLLRFRIPELVSFHDEVLHEIWHEAYPNNDIAAIKAAVPAFKEKAAALTNVQWPAALGDQIEVIKGQVVELQNAVSALEAACQSGDTEAIKKATENVHSRYEKIARML